MTYQPLHHEERQFRLLHLEPRLIDNKTSCRFSTTNLENHLDYEALSYVWGDSKDTEAILIEGKTTLIRANLATALRFLRLRGRHRVLWIDALCIDQQNEIEKTYQVKCMGNIFEQACSVIVWLGTKWDEVDIAMNWLETVGSKPELHLNANLEPAMDVDDLSGRELSRHVLRFYNNPWWQRLWTVQEAVLAKQLIFQWRGRTLSGDLLVKCYENRKFHVRHCCNNSDWYFERDRTFRMSMKDGERLLDDLNNARTNLHSPDLLYQLAVFRNRKASDGRDKVYGMLGLASDSLKRLLEPNYTWSIERVFEKTTLAFVYQSGSFDILSHLYGPRSLDLPSFVVDWSAPIKATYLDDYVSRVTAINLYNACSGRAAEIREMPHGSIMAKGYVFDEIMMVGEEFHDDGGREDRLNNWQSIIRVNGGLESVYKHTGECCASVFWRILCADIMWTRGLPAFRRLDPDKDIVTYRKWYKWITTPKAQKSLVHDTDVGSFNSVYWPAVLGRRFISTRKGYFGLAPNSTMPGDFVVVLAGGKVPYLFRKCDENWVDERQRYSTVSCFRILGDSYIHGMMDGEALATIQECDDGDQTYESRQMQDICII